MNSESHANCPPDALESTVARVEEAVARLEQAWCNAETVDIASLLPPPSDDHFREMLIELIKVDLEIHWRSREKRRVEDYLRDWPMLAADTEAVAELVEAECVTRAAFDTTPTPKEMVDRFPAIGVDWELVEAEGEEERLATCLVKPGQNFGKHEIRGLLGIGGMGSVYRAYHPGLQCEVALKIPFNRDADSGRLLRRFHREAPAAALVRHPNVCPVLDAGEVDGLPYLTMAYIEGPSLATRLGKGPIAPAEAAEITWKLANALGAVHAANLIHRDIKPSNILLDSAGEPFLTDFGLAGWLEADCDQAQQTEPSVRGPTRRSRLTRTHAVLGTPAYMSPEQLARQTLDARTDIYSLGVVLYQMLTGRLPHGELDLDTEENVKTTDTADEGGPPSPRVLCPTVDLALESICLKAMARDADDRYGSAAELAETLDKYRASQRHPLLLKGKPRWVVVLVVVSLLVLLMLYQSGIVVRIYRGDEKVGEVRGPDGMVVDVSDDGSQVNVHLPDAAKTAVGSVKSVGWNSTRCDSGGTSCYPFASTRPAGPALTPYRWSPASQVESIHCVRTGDLDGDGYPEVVVVDGETLAAHDPWGRELWRRQPRVDSQLVMPEGRVLAVSNVEVCDLDGDGRCECVVVAGSNLPDGWTPVGPQRIVVYAGDGKPVRHFPILDGAVATVGKCFDFNGDGSKDVIVTTATYRHPHAVCIYGATKGTPLWRTDFADNPMIGGVGHVDGDGFAEILLLADFDCHVDPPVGDYDSDHCYAVLFDAQGQRMWKQTYENALNGCLADLDGDKTSEIILIHEATTDTNVFILDPKTGIPVSSLRGLHERVKRRWAVADFAGDGRLQLALGDGQDLLLIDGGAKIQRTIPLPEANVLAANDLNGNGRQDLVVGQGDQLLVFSGELKEIARFSARGDIHEAIVTDLDVDGVNEIILRISEKDVTGLEIVHFEPPRAGRTQRSYQSQECCGRFPRGTAQR